MRILTLTTIVVQFLVCTTVAAQDKSPVNFDKVTISDFTVNPSTVDTSHGAIILADIGRSSFESNDKGFFALVFKLQRRVKVLSPKGFDVATIKIPLYKSTKTDAEETLESLKASTYNLVNGKVQETKLNKDDVFREVQDKNHILRKFTMPAVKEGSIIDISYTIKSDFLFNLQPWSFQGVYPRVWSEYVLNLPEFFEYIFLSRGTHPFHIKDSKEKFQSYNIRIPAESMAYGKDDIIMLNSTNSISRWVMKDVPVLNEEAFTSSMSNHRAYIEFQMSGQRFPNTAFRDIMGSWSKAKEELLKDPNFAQPLYEENGWANETLNALSLTGKSNLEKAKLIYYFVQKNFKSLGTRGYEISQTLKQTLNTRKGYVPDINMLLVALFKKADLQASPAILSTAANGFATPQYPLLSQYNYVLARIISDGQTYFLDASQPGLGFGKLPVYTYNGTVVVMDKIVAFEKLFPENITESKVTYAKLLQHPGDKNKWTANFESKLGYYESLDLREDIIEKGKEDVVKKITDSYVGEFSANKVDFGDFDQHELPLTVKYDITIDRGENNSIIYFNPMLKEGIKENYFKSAERKYPVELPFKIDETFKIDVLIPEGYELDETPQSAKVSLNEGDGGFEYIVTKGESIVSVHTRLQIHKAFFTTEEYEALRGFFDYVVKKHAEQIVFKKKS